MNYYRRYVGDYLRKTSRLSMVEHGAYTLLLDYYYADERPLPADKLEIYTMVRAMAPVDRKAVDKILALFFTETPEGYRNTRADEELTKAQPAISASKVNGARGGRPRNPVGFDIKKPSGLDGGLHPPSSNLHPPTSILQPPASNHQPKGKTKAPSVPLVVPSWLPPEWQEYEQHRKEKRSPLTATARNRCIQKLDAWRREGKDVALILRHNIENGYTGLFEPNARASQRGGNNTSAVAEAKRRIFGELERDITHDS